MSITLASLFEPKFSWSVFGHLVEVNVGKAPALVSAMGVDKDTVLNVVQVKCVRADGMCFPVSTIVILPGEGMEVVDGDVGCCCNESGLRVWNIRPEASIPFISISKASLSQLVSLEKRVQPKGASLTFGKPRLSGSVLSVDIRIYWSENVLGTDVTLLDGTYTVNVDFGVQNPYPIHLLDVEGPFGIPISVDAKILVQLNPNKVCAEIRASWQTVLGNGNVQGPHGCQGF